MAQSQRGGGVPCPKCGGALTAHLEVGIEFRLTRASQPEPGYAYGLGAVHTHVPRIRERALRQFGDGTYLELGDDGIVVMCRSGSCNFVGTLTTEGIESEDDRRRERGEP